MPKSRSCIAEAVWAVPTIPGSRLATTNHTGMRRNSLWDFALEMRGWEEFPAFLGLTFFLRGTGIFPHWFGNLSSPGTFGAVGAGSTVFWVIRSAILRSYV